MVQWLQAFLHREISGEGMPVLYRQYVSKGSLRADCRMQERSSTRVDYIESTVSPGFWTVWYKVYHSDLWTGPVKMEIKNLPHLHPILD